MYNRHLFPKAFLCSLALIVIHGITLHVIPSSALEMFTFFLYLAATDVSAPSVINFMAPWCFSASSHMQTSASSSFSNMKLFAVPWYIYATSANTPNADFRMMNFPVGCSKEHNCVFLC